MRRFYSNRKFVIFSIIIFVCFFLFFFNVKNAQAGVYTCTCSGYNGARSCSVSHSHDWFWGSPKCSCSCSGSGAVRVCLHYAVTHWGIVCNCSGCLPVAYPTWDYACRTCSCGTDGWYDTGSTRWIDDPANPCQKKEQKQQEYRDYYCSGGHCNMRVTNTRWLDTGNTQPIDPDTKQSCCQYLGKHWSVGGEIAATACCGDDSGEYYLTSVSGDACCNSPSKCVVEEACRTPVSKVCSADDAKDNSISELGNAIDDNWCTWNEHDGCLVRSGVQLVNGQTNPSFWEGESCGGDGGSSVLWGEKKVYVDNINKYISIKARVYVDDESWVWINGNEVSGLHRDCCGWTGWVETISYFHTGWNTIKFKAADYCSGGRYFNLDWDIVPNRPPTARISCDPSGCNSTDCVGYVDCPFVLKNDSTDPDGQDDIVKTEWDILGWGSEVDGSCSGICDITPTTIGVPPGTYTAKLYVEDSASQSDTATISFTIKQDAIAGFSCSLDNKNWVECENLQPSAGEVVYFSDSQPSPLDHSSPSEGASITSRVWEIVGEGIFNLGNNSNASTTLSQGDNTIKLTITDSQGRTDYQTHQIGVTVPLPEWEEMSP